MAAGPPRQGGRPFSRLALARWLHSARGRQLIALESRELGRVLPDVFGRYLLQIGSWGQDGELIARRETLHHAVIGSVTDCGDTALAEVERLPVASKTADAVVLPHTLEFSRSPHNVLREVNRVLTDRGRLFILGFNPWGLWGLRQRLGLRHAAFPEGARHYTAGRVCDWLELLDLEVTEVRRFSTGFPWTPARSDGETWSPASLVGPLTEGYLVCARKRVLPVDLVGRVQRAQVRPLVGVATPAARRQRTDQPPSAA